MIDTTSDKEKASQSCFKCFRELCQKADAVYVTALLCADSNTRQIADILKRAHVPSFSMVGSKYVKDGIMLSISNDSGYTGLGRYNARKFGKILNGTRPRDLNQIFEDPLDIAVNMATAKAINFDIPKSILKIATEIMENKCRAEKVMPLSSWSVFFTGSWTVYGLTCLLNTTLKTLFSANRGLI